jgi:predicted transcriptional regulator
MEKAESGEQVTQEWVDQQKAIVASKFYPIKDYKLGKQINDALSQLRYDIVLNKQQY